MLYLRKKDKAQSALEYALIIAVAAASLLAMQVYLKRGLQGRLRAQSDELGEQYAPRSTTGIITLSSKSRTRSTSETKSEVELNTDLDDDGVLENDVFGTETISELLPGSGSNQTGWEATGQLESSLQ